MRTYFLGSGVIMAFIFLLFAAFAVQMFGLEKTSYLATLLFAAAVMKGGAYAMLSFGAVAVHVLKRVWKRELILEPDD